MGLITTSFMYKWICVCKNLIIMPYKYNTRALRATTNQSDLAVILYEGICM